MPTPEARAARHAQWADRITFFFAPVAIVFLMAGVLINYAQQVNRERERGTSQYNELVKISRDMIEVFRDRNDRLDKQNKMLDEVRVGQTVASFRLQRIERGLGLELMPEPKAKAKAKSEIKKQDEDKEKDETPIK